MAESDITVEILKDIRGELRATNQRLATVEVQLGGVQEQLGGMQQQLGGMQQQLGVVGTALLDLAEQQRFVVRYTKVLSERDSRLDARMSALETRVDRLESK